jgi:hypothetical protein
LTPAHPLVSLTGQRHVLTAYVPQMFPNCGARNPWDAVRSLEGASCLYEGHTYFERNIGGRYIYFGGYFARLKYFTYRLVPVKKSCPTTCYGGAWGGEVQLLFILDLGTRWKLVVSVTPRPRFNPRERVPGTHCTGGWEGLRAGLDTETRGKILCLCRRSNLNRPVIQPVVRHYTA